MRMRGREFKLRLTEEEHSHLAVQAQKAGLTRGQFLRNGNTTSGKTSRHIL